MHARKVKLPSLIFKFVGCNIEIKKRNRCIVLSKCSKIKKWKKKSFKKRKKGREGKRFVRKGLWEIKKINNDYD
jgi:hypothetical protein